MKIGLIYEGLTDFPVLKHVIQAYFEDVEIKDIQPELDARQTKQISEGGWEAVANFLKTDQFEVAVENTDYVVIQIDTDVCELENFKAAIKSMADLNHDDFYELIKNKLIEWINFYGAPLNPRKNKRFAHYSKFRKKTVFDNYGKKVIFAICVHSLECWLLAYHGTKGNKTVGCLGELGATLRRKGHKLNTVDKNVHEYIEHSKDLKKSKNHGVVIAKSRSFELFVEQLKAIP